MWLTHLPDVVSTLKELEINLVPLAKIDGYKFKCYFTIKDVPESLFIAMMNEISTSFSCVFFHHWEYENGVWYVTISIEQGAAHG